MGELVILKSKQRVWELFAIYPALHYGILHDAGRYLKLSLNRMTSGENCIRVRTSFKPPNLLKDQLRVRSRLLSVTKATSNTKDVLLIVWKELKHCFERVFKR